MEMGRLIDVLLLLRIWLQVAIALAATVGFLGVLLGVEGAERLWAFAVAATLASGLFPLWRYLKMNPEERKLEDPRQAEVEAELEARRPLFRVFKGFCAASMFAAIASMAVFFISVGNVGDAQGGLPLFAEREKYLATNHGVTREISRARYLTIRVSLWSVGGSAILFVNLWILRSLLLNRHRRDPRAGFHL